MHKQLKTVPIVHNVKSSYLFLTSEHSPKQDQYQNTQTYIILLSFFALKLSNNDQLIVFCKYFSMPERYKIKFKCLNVQINIYFRLIISLFSAITQALLCILLKEKLFVGRTLMVKKTPVTVTMIGFCLKLGVWISLC